MKNILVLLMIGFFVIGCEKTHVDTIVKKNKSGILSEQTYKLNRQIDHEQLLLAIIIVCNSCDNEAVELLMTAITESAKIDVKYNPLKEEDIRKSNEEKIALLDYIKSLQQKAKKSMQRN